MTRHERDTSAAEFIFSYADIAAIVTLSINIFAVSFYLCLFTFIRRLFFRYLFAATRARKIAHDITDDDIADARARCRCYEMSYLR